MDRGRHPAGLSPGRGPTSAFYASVPVFEGFARIMDPLLYRPLPDGWLIGLTDVVQSTRAIQSGRYKAVNMAGAAGISAMANALRSYDFPFVFGGDGASFAVSSADEPVARDTLARTAAWVRDEIGFGLRAALVPVSAVRAGGADVRIARFAPSAHVSYAMFSGGGLSWAEQAMKSGAFAVAPAAAGARPDLTGLSCRWEEMPASRGIVLSLIVMPAAAGDLARFRDLVEQVLALVEEGAEASRPMPAPGRGVHWPPTGLDLEARASRREGQSLLKRRLGLGWETLVSYAVFRFGLRVGRFDPALYRRDLVENADFRKYDDVLRMTLDCTPALADRIEAHLAAAAASGAARYGLHRQDAALLTCIVPSIHERNHVHFVDGAAGGYAMAARRVKGM